MKSSFEILPCFLELWQYKNVSHSVEKNSNFDIAALYGKGKNAAISRLEFIWTEWSRSYIF